MINLVYLSSWHDGSIVRLPPTELVGDYVKALESVSTDGTMHLVDQRANELTGSDPTGSSKPPRRLKQRPYPSCCSISGALTYLMTMPLNDLLLRAVDLAAEVVGNLAMSGDSSETEARQSWTQTLAGPHL